MDTFKVGDCVSITKESSRELLKERGYSLQGVIIYVSPHKSVDGESVYLLQTNGQKYYVTASDISIEVRVL